MSSGQDIIEIKDGMSVYPKVDSEIYEIKIRSFLQGLNYDVFGDSDRRTELRRYNFSNLSNKMLDSLQKTIKEVLLIEFPEIEVMNIALIRKDGGYIGYSIDWRLLEDVGTTEGDLW